MPGVSGVTVVTILVWFFNFHARLRVHRAPGIPHALCFLGEYFMHDPGAPRRGNVKARPLFDIVRFIQLAMLPQLAASCSAPRSESA